MKLINIFKQTLKEESSPINISSLVNKDASEEEKLKSEISSFFEPYKAALTSIKPDPAHSAKIVEFSKLLGSILVIDPESGKPFKVNIYLKGNPDSDNTAIITTIRNDVYINIYNYASKEALASIKKEDFISSLYKYVLRAAFHRVASATKSALPSFKNSIDPIAKRVAQIKNK